MKTRKKLFKEHSPYLILLTLAEILLSVVATLSFVYTDSLQYSDSAIISGGVEKLLETVYSSTWWALILFLLFFIALFAFMSIIYKKLEYLTISIGCWVEMLILSINVGNNLKELLINLLLFIPIFILNIIAYKTEKNKLNTKTKKVTKK